MKVGQVIERPNYGTLMRIDEMQSFCTGEVRVIGQGVAFDGTISEAAHNRVEFLVPRCPSCGHPLTPPAHRAAWTSVTYWCAGCETEVVK